MKERERKKNITPQLNPTGWIQWSWTNGHVATHPTRILFGRVNLLTLLPSLSKIGQQHRVVVVRKSFFFFYGPKFFFDPITSADVRAAHPLPRPPSCCFVDMFPITVDMIADKILWVGKLHNLSTPLLFIETFPLVPRKVFLHVITSIWLAT